MGTAQRVCERKSVWVGLGWSLEFYVEMSGWVVENNLDRTIQTHMVSKIMNIIEII